MVKVKPFKGLRPSRSIVESVSCPPYDVMNSAEASALAKGNKFSFLHVTRAEIDVPGCTDEHDPAVYDKARENFMRFLSDGVLTQDSTPCYYVYELSMDGRKQVGLAAAVSVLDYQNGLIKKHELTRPDKEEDRMVLTRHLRTNLEPVFLAYRSVSEIDEIVSRAMLSEPEYDFFSEDGVGHRLWVIRHSDVIRRLEELFEQKVPAMYAADGHHRTAAAARVGDELARQNPNHTGAEDYNFFMAVLFPDDQLRIMDYNRVVRDLNGLSESEFLARLAATMDVSPSDSAGEFRPQRLHEFGMYLGGRWYRLSAKPDVCNDADPIEVLDVSILSKCVLADILGILDLRRSNRIDFVGGIRGLGELQRRVDSGEMKLAFAMFPVSMQQLLRIADTGNIMPPKTTWFEPKLRSGLFVRPIG